MVGVESSPHNVEGRARNVEVTLSSQLTFNRNTFVGAAHLTPVEPTSLTDKDRKLVRARGIRLR